MKVELYVEGGGSGSTARAKCRKGFRLFLERAGFTDRMPSIISCGSRHEAMDKFSKAAMARDAAGYPVLLVDSETAVTSDPWRHLAIADKWKRPSATEDDQAHLMVQVMESWFLADSDCLSHFFGQGFNKKKLPKNIDIEGVGKEGVFKSLKDATRNCQPKGEYNKGKHSFALLEKIDPAKVRESSKHAESLLSTLHKKCL